MSLGGGGGCGGCGGGMVVGWWRGGGGGVQSQFRVKPNSVELSLGCVEVKLGL